MVAGVRTPDVALEVQSLGVKDASEGFGLKGTASRLRDSIGLEQADAPTDATNKLS